MTCKKCDAVNESYRNMGRLIERWSARESVNFLILRLVANGKFSLAKEIAEKELKKEFFNK